MKKELIIEAIGNISDRHIMEFTNIDSISKTHHITRVFSIVACICIVVTISTIAGLYCKEQLTSHHGGENIIWGDGDLHSYGDATKETAELGVVKVTDELSAAFANSNSESDIFAIEVHEMSGTEKIDIYQQFILKLGVKEDYMENGIIFATKKQVASFECPTDMSIVLYLANKAEKDIVIISKDNINDFDSEIFLVTVHLYDDIEKVLQDLGRYETILSPDEYQTKRLSAIQENVEATVSAV